MGATGDQAPEIPGFQPLHIRGAGRLGIWIEARQVRLDRRVLLKVLPAAEQSLQQEFVREVQALVRLDGEGALRVIDEGAVGAARYVALDEGEALPLKGPLQDPRDKLQLGCSMLDLYQQLHALEIVAGPIPASALRRLPSGGFVVAEMGAVEEQGSEQEIRNRAAITIEQMAAIFRLGAPWPEVARVIRNEVDGFRKARGVIDRHQLAPTRVRSRIALLVGVVLIVAVGFLGPRWWREVKRDPVDEGLPPVTVSSSVDEEGDPKSGDSADEGDPGAAPDQSATGDSRQSDEIARTRIEQQDLLQRQFSTWEVWWPRRDQILNLLEAGELAAGRRLLASLPPVIEDSDAYGSMTAEKESLLQAWLWIEQRAVARARARIDASVSVDAYEVAADALAELARDLGLEQRYSPEIERLKRRGQLFRTTLATMERRMEQVLLELPSFGVTSWPLPQGVSSFEGLHRRWNSFERDCQFAQQDVQSILDAAKARLEADELFFWSVKDGGPLIARSFEARVTAVDENTISLRRVGRRNPEVHPWNTVHGSTLEQMAIEAGREVTDSFRFRARVRTIWGGSESILEIARDPRSAEEVLGTAGRLCWQRVEQWLADGELAEQQGDVQRQRSRAVEIARWVEKDQRPQVEKRLLRWWAALADRDGPAALGLFREAGLSEWDPTTRSLQIRSLADERGLPGWKPTDGSSISSRGELAWVQGRVHLDSPVRFSTSLEVRVIGLVTREDAPNFNMVLWDGSSDSLLFGVGIRPPQVSSIRVGEVDVLLPAHMIIEEKLLAEGGGEIPMPAPRPRVVPGKPSRLMVREDGEGASLEVDGTMVIEADPRPVALLGGVAIETFGVPVVIREVVIVGRIARDDWFELLQKSARSALWNDR